MTKKGQPTQERTIDESDAKVEEEMKEPAATTDQIMTQVDGQTKPAQEGTTNQSDAKVEEKKEPAATTDDMMTQVEGQTKPTQERTTNQTNEFSMKKAPLFSTMIDGL